MADSSSSFTEPSAASQLLQQHMGHTVTVEDVPDEDLSPTVATTKLDTQSHDSFPELSPAKSKGNPANAPIWNAKSTGNGATNGSDGAPKGAALDSTDSGRSTPTPDLAGHAPPSLAIPGRNVETLFLEPQHVLPRAQLKRPLPDIIKDVNRKTRANITMTTLANGRLRFEASGPQNVAKQALEELLQQIGTKQSVKVPIPQSARAHLIGKGGSTIKSIQDKTGARIHVPKMDETQLIDEDDDTTIDVIIEGNSLSAAMARNSVLKIVRERTPVVNSRIKGVPAEFYPFLASRQTDFADEPERSGVQVRIPAHEPWSSQPPQNVLVDGCPRPVYSPAPLEHQIQVSGERAAVQTVRAEIERCVQDLHRELTLQQVPIQHGRHQFIIGERGIPVGQFFTDTGCAIILPTDDDDTVSVIGPASQVQVGVDRAIDLAMNMQMSNIDISRFHRSPPGGAAAHARNVTRYLRYCNEIARLEKMYNIHLNTPFSEEGALPWEVYSRDAKNAVRVQAELKGLVDCLPPSRMRAFTVDPFYYTYLRRQITPRVHQDYGVRLVVPDVPERRLPVLLVYEGPSAAGDAATPPRVTPLPADVSVSTQGLQLAWQHLADLLGRQEPLASQSLDVPLKFHEKLQKFIRAEQANRGHDHIPVRVSNVGTTVTIRGPQSGVETLVQKSLTFLEQAHQDERERGFTLDFDFPQKFFHHLIGKGGSKIRDLRDKFDVEVQVMDGGKVQLRGPKAKAELARSNILAYARQLEDEVTHVLRIDPKFHGELIGAQGQQITRLQNRYKVLIFFPRLAKNSGDDEGNTDTASEGGGKPRRHQAADEVWVRGPKRGADEARDELLSLLQYLKDNSFTAVVAVHRKHIPQLIGQRGAGMDQIREATGAKIDVPNAREPDEDELVAIKIKGTQTQVAAARKLLEEKKAVLDDTIIKTIDVDQRHHKALIGAGGTNLREMVLKAGGSDDRRELARTIQFPKADADGNTIKIEGRTDVVNKLVEHIESIVRQRESEVVETLEVPIEKHRLLVGRGGEVKRNLESQLNVSLDIPRQGSGITGVKITGQPGDVDRAKAHIGQLVMDTPTEVVQVPRKCHHALSNNGQIFRRLKSDHHVTVDHAGHALPAKPTMSMSGNAPPHLITDDSSDPTHGYSWKVVENGSAEEGDIPWILHGSPENIEKAKRVISAALAEAEKANTTGYLILPDPRTHRYVIGHGGSTINSIRRQTGCKITVPRERGQPEAIEVIGSADGVGRAKELILDAVRDGASGNQEGRSSSNSRRDRTQYDEW